MDSPTRLKAAKVHDGNHIVRPENFSNLCRIADVAGEERPHVIKSR